jgi:DNA primase
MEGYMDVIMAHQHGASEAVASMGTAITEKQVNILKKLSRNLILSLDADAAGEEAILRTVGYENILNAEMRVIILPEGKDPDEVIRDDIKRWQDLVEKAVPLIDFLFEKTTAKLDLSTARGKSGAVDRILPVVAEISDPIRQAHYLQKLAALAKVDMNTIKASLSRLKSARSTARKGEPVIQIEVKYKPASSKREEYCLSLLLQYPELKNRMKVLSPEFFESSENREIFNTCHEIADISSLKEKLDPAIHEHLDAVIQSVVYKTLPFADIERRYADGVCELKKTYLKKLAARRAETGEISTEISEQLREIDMDARESKKRNPSYNERVRR